MLTMTLLAGNPSDCTTRRMNERENIFCLAAGFAWFNNSTDISTIGAQVLVWTNK